MMVWISADQHTDSAYLQIYFIVTDITITIFRFAQVFNRAVTTAARTICVRTNLGIAGDHRDCSSDARCMCTWCMM